MRGDAGLFQKKRTKAWEGAEKGNNNNNKHYQDAYLIYKKIL